MKVQLKENLVTLEITANASTFSALATLLGNLSMNDHLNFGLLQDESSQISELFSELERAGFECVRDAYSSRPPVVD